MTTPRRRQSRLRTRLRPSSHGAPGRPEPTCSREEGSAGPPGRPIPPKERAALARLLQHLARQSRRLHAPRLEPSDPLFPELEQMGPDEIAEMVAQTMEHEGIDPARIYAFRKTGLLVTSDETLRLLSAADRQAWTGAVQQYLDRQD